MTKEAYKVCAKLAYKRSYGLGFTEEEFVSLFDAFVTTVEEGEMIIVGGNCDDKRENTGVIGA